MSRRPPRGVLHNKTAANVGKQISNQGWVSSQITPRIAYLAGVGAAGTAASNSPTGDVSRFIDEVGPRRAGDE